MSQGSSIVEMIFNQYVQGKSRDEARRLTKLMLEREGLSGVDEALDALEQKHREQVLDRMKLTEIGTSRKKDLLEMGWYAGVGDSGVWGALRERMRGQLGDAVTSVDRSSEEIVASLAQPFVDEDKRLGLVIGNVQSGKTGNYSSVVAKALDSGYKFVLVLSGVHNNLRSQTQGRLDRDLGVLDNPRDWFRLTDVGADFGDAQSGNASSIVSKHSRILAVVKKNGHRLRNVLKFLRSLDSATMRNTPFLIIDDESDQATPDASAKPEDDPTAINRLMREIWHEVRNGSYVGYTATPFANVFMNPNTADDPLQELYPGDFIHVMPTPRSYFGAERIFGLNESDSEERDAVVPNVVRDIPASEVELLAPRGRDISRFDPHVTTSLGAAIRWFVVACAVRRIRGQQKKHSTMLIHTTHRVDPHFAIRDAVEEYLEPLRADALNGDVEIFREIFREEINRAPELYSGDGIAPTWPRVSDEIPNVLRYLKTSVDNGKAEESDRLAYGDEPQTVIVIGGGTLSRGLTLEGLFVSFFTRTSNTYDTLLQMGRWFGYRNGYEDLQRIWLSPGLENDYRFLATVESDLRDDVARMTQAGATPAEIGVRVRLHPGRLQVTSAAKMKHVQTVETDFEGYRLQTTRFDASDADTLSGNARAAEGLFSRISMYRSAAAPTLFEGVPVGALDEFFDEFTVHPQFTKLFQDAVAWSKEKLPDVTWNVVVPAEGTGTDTLDVAGIDVRSVRRAPIRTNAESLLESGEINIRALMAGNDIIADLRLQGNTPPVERGARLTNQQQLAWRKHKDGGAGRGLLVLYPISRRSAAVSTSERMDMDTALRAIDPALLRGAQPPIIGLALIAPSDAYDRLVAKGTQVAVVPAFDDAEDLDEQAPVDSERDFRGIG